MENNNTNEKVKKELKLTGDEIVQNRVDDIKTDPEFEFREKRLQKKMKNLSKNEK
jgi:hypothetical protein